MRFIIPIYILFLYFVCSDAYSQQAISGQFSGLAGQKVKLVGFNGLDTYGIDSTKVDETGDFHLSFHTKDYGMGYIAAEDNKPFFVILAAGENLSLQGESLANTEMLNITCGNQNRLFERYANEHVRREQTLSAWDYLEKIYSLDTLFAVHDVPKHAIASEKQRIKTEDSLFLASIDKNTYVSWYLPLRKLVSSVSFIAQYRPAEIPASIAAFRAIDYTDNRLCKSGLLSDVIESHFWLIENSGRLLDSVYLEMNSSIDFMFETLTKDEKMFNDISAYLFKLLERRSLFQSAEYLSLKVLNEVSCTINKDLASQMESYRAMKKGNTAPDFVFQKDVFAPGYPPSTVPKKLSDIKSAYRVLVFGASWCPKCPEELFQIVRVYEKWKNNGVEVVYVSLDEDTQIFKSFISVFPFISMCDYRKWESPIVKAYHVFATPTIYLLDAKHEILLKPNSVSQMDAWVDWYVVQGKK